MDLLNPTNWVRVASWDLRVANLFYTASGKPRLRKGYTDIQPVETTLATPVGLIKTTAPETELQPNWDTACWFSAYLPLRPGSMDRVYRETCSLNEGTYLHLPNFGVFPYHVKIAVPWYLPSLKIELWQFTDQSGKYLQSSQQAVLSAIEVVEQRNVELSSQIEQLRQQT